MKKNPNTIVVGTLECPGFLEYTSRVYSPEGIAPSITTLQGGGRQPKIIEYELCVSPIRQRG